MRRAGRLCVNKGASIMEEPLRTKGAGQDGRLFEDAAGHTLSHSLLVCSPKQPSEVSGTKEVFAGHFIDGEIKAQKFHVLFKPVSK